VGAVVACVPHPARATGGRGGRPPGWYAPGTKGTQGPETTARSAVALTTRTALIYLHTENGRDQMIADGMGRLADEALRKSQDREGSGT
jgi:hypothetical protein